MNRPPRPIAIFCASLAGSLTLFAACGTTPGQPSAATLRLAPSIGTFTTSTGWEVTLDEAVLAPASAYFYAPSGDAMARLSRELFPVALAHGGHDPFGTRPVRQEWLGPALLDLLGDETVEVGVMDGSVGASTEVTIAFDPLAGTLAESSGPNHAHHAWISGTASRVVDGETETIAFEGGFDFAEGGTENLIEAVPADATVAASGTWTLHVALSRWLDGARFERLPENASAPRAITPATQVGIAWDLGLRDPAGYELSYQPLLSD